MKMLKFLGLIVLSIVATGCLEQDKLVKVSIVVSASTPSATAFREVFKPRVEELTEGRYNIAIYDSGILGSEKTTYDYTKNGIIELSVVGSSMWSESPKVAISDFPFVFRDVHHAKKAYQGELGEYIRPDLEITKKVKLLGWFPNGARAFSSNKTLTKLDDFKGQKLRMPNNPIHIKLAESLGANVVVMNLGEVFAALEQGVVDGQDNPISTVRNEGWFEVQKHIYDTNHIIASLELFINADFFESLSKEDQEAFTIASNEASDYAWDLYISKLEEDKRFMSDKNLQVSLMNESTRQEMIQKIKPVYDYLDATYSWAKEARELIADIE